jgi:hypothetical protein
VNCRAPRQVAERAVPAPQGLDVRPTFTDAGEHRGHLDKHFATVVQNGVSHATTELGRPHIGETHYAVVRTPKCVQPEVGQPHHSHRVHFHANRAGKFHSEGAFDFGTASCDNFSSPYHNRVLASVVCSDHAAA